MKAISARPEREWKLNGSACKKPEKKMAWMWAAGLALALLGIVSGCGNGNTDYRPSSTCTPSYMFNFNDMEVPTLRPIPTYQAVPPSPTPVTEVLDLIEPLPTAEYAGLEILSVTSPVAPDGYATLTARGKPGVKYKITVTYHSGPSSASGLYAKTADEDGLVSWTWHVGPSTREGKWKIVISGGGEKKSAHFTVKK